MMLKSNRLARDTRGTATIELALLSPILATMLIGMVDLSMAYSDKLRLEQVAQRTMERVQGSEFKTTMKTTLETEAEAAAGSGADATVTFWLECNGAEVTTNDPYGTSCSNGEIMSRYVEIDIQRTYTPVILKAFDGFNANGTYTVHGVAGIRVL